MRNASIAVLAALAVVGLSAGAHAQDVRARLAPGQAPAKATLESLRGLVGQWAGPGGAAGFSAPAAGQMIGHLSVYGPNGQPVVDELWVFRPEGDSVLDRQKIFGGDLSARQDKEVWAQRKLVAIDPGHIYLEDLTWTTAGDTLTLDVRVPGPNGGPPVIGHTELKRVR